MDIGRTDHLGLGGEDRQLPVGADLALGLVCVCVCVCQFTRERRENESRSWRVGGAEGCV